MIIDFEGQTIVITGASAGIGKTLYNKFLELGGEVIGTTNTKKNKDLIKLDLNKKQSLTKFLRFLRKRKKIDVLINNAGINIINPINKIKEKDLKKILNVNLEAPIKICHEVSKKMIKNNYGKIINISSIFGNISKEKRVVYSVSKFGINGLTKGSAVDLASKNILVNSVSPGFVLTDLTKKILGKKISKIEKTIPLKRLAKTDEIANIIIFLASKKNTYLTGQNIIVDGGFTSV